MAETKKRWRPSLTAYRELEKKLANQIDGTSRLVKDCDLWRERCRELEKKLQEATDDFNDLNGDKKILEHSNKLMEEELKRVRNHRDELLEVNQRNLAYIERMESRGWFARLLNKK